MAVVATRRGRDRDEIPHAPAAAAEARAGRIRQLISSAEAAEAAGDVRQIEQSLKGLIEIDPDNPRWWKGLIRLQSLEERLTEVVETRRSALRRALPEDVALDFRIDLIAQLIDIGDAAAARAQLDALLESRAEGPRVDAAIAQVLRLEGKSDEALDHLSVSLPENHGNVSAYRMLGHLLFDRRRFEEARDQYEAARQLDPCDDMTEFRLAECCRFTGDQKAETAHRERYAQLHAARLEIQRLLLRPKEGQPLDAAAKLRLSELSRVIGNERDSAYWRQQAERDQAK